MARDRDSVIASCAQIAGWMSEAALGWLYDQAQALPPYSLWAEVGIYQGRSYLCVLQAISTGSVVYGVDDFRGVTEDDMSVDIRRALLQNVVASGCQNFCFCFEESTKTAQRFRPGYFDVVFIDGAHDYASVAADIGAWRAVVKAGGLLCGHDCSGREVKQALNRLLPGWREEPGDIWSLRV